MPLSAQVVAIYKIVVALRLEITHHGNDTGKTSKISQSNPTQTPLLTIQIMKRTFCQKTAKRALPT